MTRRKTARRMVLTSLAAAAACLSPGVASAAPVTSHVAPAAILFRIWEIHEHEQGKCLDVRTQDNADAPGARVQRFGCSGANEQRWRFNVITPGTYRFFNWRSGLCLDLEGGSTAFNTQVIQATCDAASLTQLWQFDPVIPTRSNSTSAAGQIRSLAAPAMCLDTLDNWARIFPCASPPNSAQLWHFQEFDKIF